MILTIIRLLVKHTAAGQTHYKVCTFKSDGCPLHQGLEKAVEHFLRGNPAVFAGKNPRISSMAVAKNLKAFSA
ncbi:MAG: hypothetical protein IJ688_08915, partial [Treponema sp.]|uniref:hypothetical protein n=1 Tax=Treponema sp. TaxID=166 RepID=UPI0025CEB0E6